MVRDAFVQARALGVCRGCIISRKRGSMTDGSGVTRGFRGDRFAIRVAADLKGVVSSSSFPPFRDFESPR